jgi:glutamine amidotransferase
MIGIIDYGVGNIRAFVNIYRKLSIPVRIIKNQDDFEGIAKLILPGVGSFDYAMIRLDRSGLRSELDRLVFEEKMPVLGVCVGMQMLANDSDEGRLPGLKWIDASVKKFDADKIPFETHLPHMGWNDVKTDGTSLLFDGLEEDAKFYFLHSYYFHTIEPSTEIAICKYGIEFSCAVNYRNIFGVQFHPEKSHHYGIGLLKNFATKC